MKAISLLPPLMALAFSPLLTGVINRVKALFAGRRGPSMFQLYYDVAKLLQKGSVYSGTSTLATRVAPSISLGAIICALAIVPCGSIAGPASFGGDMIMLAYLLGLARFATIVAALDAGSSFQGMGASREAQFSALVEPAFLLGLLAIAARTGQTALSSAFTGIAPGATSLDYSPLLLVGFAWMVALLAENSRIPVDDPCTHLELTMIHEVMVLDYSGPDLGYIFYGSALKLWIFCAMIVNLIMPLRQMPAALQLAAFAVGMAVVAAIVGVVESVTARLRLKQVPKALIGAGAVSAIALIMKMLGEKL